MIRILFKVSLLALLFFVFSAAPVFADYKANVKKGNELVKAGKYAESLNYYRAAQKEKPNKKLAAHIKKVEARAKSVAKKKKKKKRKKASAGSLARLPNESTPSFNTSGLHGIFYLNNATVAELGAFSFAPYITCDFDSEKSKSNMGKDMSIESSYKYRVTRFLLNGNYGVADNIEAGLSVPIISVSTSIKVKTAMAGMPTIESSSGGSATGIGDIRASGKYLFLEQGHKKPAVAGILRIDLPTGDTKKGLGQGLDIFLSGATDYTTGRITYTGELGFVIAGDYEVEITMDTPLGPITMTVDLPRGNYIFLGAGVSWSASDKMDVLGSLYVNGYEDSGSMLNAGVAYHLNEKMDLKGGLMVGLEDATPGFGLTLGLGVGF